MAERYIKVFSGDENLHTDGAPVVIRASALLKDTETGKMIAQLKLQNISGKSISYVKLAVTPLDSVKAPIGDPIVFEYLDLSVADKDEFGAKKPLHLPNPSTRSFRVGVSLVGYADGTVWNSDNTDWQSAAEDSDAANIVMAEDTYKKAAALAKSEKKEDLEEAQALFESISQVKDVSIEINNCRERINELSLKAEQKKKTKKKVTLISAIVGGAVALLLIAYLIISMLIPWMSFTKAGKLAAQEEFDAAMEKYAEISNSFGYEISLLPLKVYDEMDRTAEQAVNNYISNGSVKDAFAFVLRYKPYIYEEYLDFYNINDEALCESVYSQIEEILNTPDFFTTDDVDSVMYSEDMIVMKNILYALPEDYKDVKNLRLFFDRMNDRESVREKFMLYQKEVVEEIWEYSLVRSICTRHSDMIYTFLEGSWRDLRNITMFRFTAKSSYMGYDVSFHNVSLTLPNVEHSYYSIDDCILSYSDSNGKICDVLRFEFIETDPDKMSVYNYKTGETMVLYRY